MEAYCIYETDAGSDPTFMRNNDLYRCPTALYVDAVDGSGCLANDGCLTSIAAVNALADTTASANISDDPMFVTSTSVAPLDMNLRFTSSSPASVTSGGLNGIDELWSFDYDFFADDRPAAGNPWAMGPFRP